MNTSQTFKLKNGLAIILIEKPDVYSVSFCVAVRAGSKYETSDNIGAAHFFEHMLFEGTEKYPDSRSLGQVLESVGGRSTAWTDKDYVQYSVKLPREEWETGLDYLSQILFHPQFSPNTVGNEKKIITEEYKRKTDNSEMETWELFMKHVFGQDTYLGRSILGTLPAINLLTKNKLEEYLKLHYSPKNMVLAIAGNFDAKIATSRIKNYFELETRKNKIPLRTTKVLPNDKQVFFESSSDLQAQIVLGFVTGVTITHEDLPTLKVIRNILGFGLGSRITQKLVYKQGIAYSTGVWNVGYQDTGIFCVSCGVSSENIDIAIQSILEEFIKLKSIQISENELREAIIQELAEKYYTYENTESIALDLATQELLEGKVKEMQEIETELKAVTQNDVKRIANKYFTSQNLKVLVRGPIPVDQKKKTEHTIEFFK